MNLFKIKDQVIIITNNFGTLEGLTVKYLLAQDAEVVFINLNQNGFRPVLNWIRINLDSKLKNGNKYLHHTPLKFFGFKIYPLKMKKTKKKATLFQPIKTKGVAKSFNQKKIQKFQRTIISVFSGYILRINIKDRTNWQLIFKPDLQHPILDTLKNRLIQILNRPELAK